MEVIVMMAAVVVFVAAGMVTQTYEHHRARRHGRGATQD